MSLLQSARKLCRDITSGDFSYELTFTAKTKEVAIINGLVAVTHYDFEVGLPVSDQNGRMTINEKDLVDQGYPVRNAAKEIILQGGTVEFEDSNGDQRKFWIGAEMPDTTLGAVTTFLHNAKVV